MAKKKKAKQKALKKKKGSIIGNNIKEILRMSEMTQADLAKKMGVGADFVSRIIHNRKKQLSLPIAFKISEILHSPIEEIFTWEN